MAVSALLLLLLSTTAFYGKAAPDSNLKCPQNYGMTDAVRNVFLRMHNKLRSSVARGLEKDALGGNAPQAAGMLKMSYDCKVEASALRHAAKCRFEHSLSEEREGYGENIYMTTAKNVDKRKAAKQASQLWWNELKEYGVGKFARLTQKLWNRPKAIGHYTQMAWQKTNKLGCAVQHCYDMTFTVCQYEPSGNWIGKRIYRVGPPCTKCPTNYKCDPNVGLCYPA